MFPQVQSVLLGWTSPVQLKVVHTAAVDFEAAEQVLDVVVLEAVLQPMSPQKVNRKPENLRVWKWWDLWSTTEIATDAVVQDPAGVQFRIQEKHDWQQGGFFHYEATEQPNGL